MRQATYIALAGVGDSSLGQWEEDRPKAFHLRRRLSAKEALLVGPVIDIRGTKEAVRRMRVLKKQVPQFPLDMILEELNSRPNERTNKSA